MARPAASSCPAGEPRPQGRALHAERARAHGQSGGAGGQGGGIAARGAVRTALTLRRVLLNCTGSLSGCGAKLTTDGQTALRVTRFVRGRRRERRRSREPVADEQCKPQFRSERPPPPIRTAATPQQRRSKVCLCTAPTARLPHDSVRRARGLSSRHAASLLVITNSPSTPARGTRVGLGTKVMWRAT
jgi:hypothetical protein